MATSEDKILETLLEIFEKQFPKAELIKPRHACRSVSLDQFTYVNDEEVDKAEEIETDETVVLGEKVETAKAAKPFQQATEYFPLVAIDSSSARLGETNEAVLAAFRTSIIIQSNEKMKCDTFGPYIAHITDGNKQAIYNYFRRKIFRLEPADAPYLLSKVGDRI